MHWEVWTLVVSVAGAIVFVCMLRSVVRSAMSKLKMCQVGRDYYLPDGAVPVPQHR